MLDLTLELPGVKKLGEEGWSRQMWRGGSSTYLNAGAGTRKYFRRRVVQVLAGVHAVDSSPGLRVAGAQTGSEPPPPQSVVQLCPTVRVSFHRPARKSARTAPPPPTGSWSSTRGPPAAHPANLRVPAVHRTSESQGGRQGGRPSRVSPLRLTSAARGDLCPAG